MALKAWIEKIRDKNGKVIAHRVRYYDAGGHRRSEPGIFKKWHDAEALRIVVDNRLFNGRLGRVDPTLLTKDLVDKWLLESKAGLAHKKAVRCKPSTLKTYRDTIKTFVEEFPKMAMIGKEPFKEWRLGIEEDCYAEHTLVGQLRSAKNFLVWAYRNKYSVWDCRDDISIVQPDAMPRFYTDRELAAFNKASIGDPFHLAYLLGRKCGMRRGEVLRADKRDFSWLKGGRGTLTIWADVSKNKKSRTVPVPASVMSLLGSRGEGLLYPGMTDRAFEYTWARFKVKAGIQEAPTWYHRRFKGAETLAVPGMRQARYHNLRHTFCRLFIETGAGDIKKLAAITGHRDLNVLHRIYGHFETRVLHDAIDIMEARADFEGVSWENIDELDSKGQDILGQDGTINETDKKAEGGIK